MSRTKVAHRFKVILTAEPDGSGWNAEIPEVPGCLSCGRSLSEARANIREALSLFEEHFDGKADEVARQAVFEEDIRLPAKARVAVKRFEQSRERAVNVARLLEVRSAKAAKALTEHVSLRDAGELLGLSQEGVRKVIQKASDSKPPARRVDAPRVHR